MALHRYGDFRVEVFYFDSPCIILAGDISISAIFAHVVHVSYGTLHRLQVLDACDAV